MIAVQVPTYVVLVESGDTHMNGETVLLRVVDGPWEGWKLMALDEFLQRVSIESWNEQQALVGMVLPLVRGSLH
jgi:hypothetical protein